MKNNKTFILYTFLSLLIVGCSNASSNLPSSSSTTSSSSSSSSSSSATSSSGSGSTSEPPVTNTKIPFNQIGSLVAQVVDAKALGVSNSKDNVSTPRGRRQAQDDEVDSSEQNKMVKVTETYNPTTKVAEDKTIEVTFTRTTNTQTTELQTGMDTYVATAENITIEHLTDEPGRVVIQNVPNYEFRALKGDILLQDWTSTEGETITFTFEETITSITLESRSTDASISFTAFEGFTYEVKSGETMIKENLKDNQEGDLNQKDGVITIKGLTQGLPYDVHYEGYVVLETITQDEVDGQVDKLYVLYQYTFISFVPITSNPRPEAFLLGKDYDDVPIYDKTNYFSDTTRQSFVVDNDTGLIYKIENIYITNLSGGCVSVKNSPFPFDMRIKDNNMLEFFSLFTNPDINSFSCLKDKFNNKLIYTSQFDGYDIQTQTTFISNDKLITEINFNQFNDKLKLGWPFLPYFLTSKGNIVKGSNAMGGWISFEVMNENGTLRNLNKQDTFEVYLQTKSEIFYDKTEIKNGNVLIYPSFNPSYFINYPGDIEISNGLFLMSASQNGVFHSIQDGDKSYFFELNMFEIIRWLGQNFSDDGQYQVSVKFLKDFDIVLYHSFSDKKVFYFRNLIQNFLKAIQLITDNYYLGTNLYMVGEMCYSDIDCNLQYQIKDLFYNDMFELTLLNGSTYNGDYEGTFSLVGLSGTINYELQPEKIDDFWSITPYVAGTYIAPPPITITFQPINR